MGMDVGGKGGPKKDINVTPLVDVVLVLLIIFLVTMPVVMRDIKIDIPKPAEDIELAPPTGQIVIEWKNDGRLLFNGNPISRSDLAIKARAKLKNMRDKVVFVDFDDNVRYGDAISVLDTVRGAGATTVALKTREDPAAAAAPADGATPMPTP